MQLFAGCKKNCYLEIVSWFRNEYFKVQELWSECC